MNEVKIRVKMVNFIRLGTVLFAAGVCSSVCYAGESGASNHSQTEQGMIQAKVNGVLQVKVNCGIEIEPECVAEFLAEAIKGDVNSKTFRVSGAYNVGSGTGTVTVPYSRAEKLVKFLAINYNENGAYITHHLYGNVSDDLIHKLAKAVKWASFKSPKDGGTKRAGAYFFDELITYGCKRTASSRFKPAPTQ